jgi:hypothetical protein
MMTAGVHPRISGNAGPARPCPTVCHCRVGSARRAERQTARPTRLGEARRNRPWHTHRGLPLNTGCALVTVLACLAVAASPPASAPAVQAQLIDGRTVEGGWMGLSSDGKIQLKTTDGLDALRPDEIMLLRWPAGKVGPPKSLPALVYLKDQSRFPARVIAGNQRSIELQTALTPGLVIAISQLSAIRLSPEPEASAQEAFQQALSEPDATQDRLIVVRNQRPTTLKGTVESIRPDGGSFRWRERVIPIRPEDSYGVVFAAGTDKLPAPTAVCTLQDGSAWAGKILDATADAIEWQLVIGPKITLPVGRISEIRFRSDRLVFLSDLKPAGYRFEPFGSTQWPYWVNRSAANRPLRIGKQTFDRGIGMHSKSVLTYDLPGEFAQLAATIGIDAGASSLGSVVFRVIADGKTVFDSGPIDAGGAPRPILVPIKGARQLQLVADFGENLDIGGQADWAEARLVR